LHLIQNVSSSLAAKFDLVFFYSASCYPRKAGFSPDSFSQFDHACQWKRNE